MSHLRNKEPKQTETKNIKLLLLSISLLLLLEVVHPQKINPGGPSPTTKDDKQVGSAPMVLEEPRIFIGDPGEPQLDLQDPNSPMLRLKDPQMNLQDPVINVVGEPMMRFNDPVRQEIPVVKFMPDSFKEGNVKFDKPINELKMNEKDFKEPNKPENAKGEIKGIDEKPPMNADKQKGEPNGNDMKPPINADKPKDELKGNDMKPPINSGELKGGPNENDMKPPINSGKSKGGPNGNDMKPPINPDKLKDELKGNDMKPPINSGEQKGGPNGNDMKPPINSGEQKGGPNGNDMKPPINSGEPKEGPNENKMKSPINSGEVKGELNRNDMKPPINSGELKSGLNGNGNDMKLPLNPGPGPINMGPLPNGEQGQMTKKNGGELEKSSGSNDQPRVIREPKGMAEVMFERNSKRNILNGVPAKDGSPGQQESPPLLQINYKPPITRMPKGVAEWEEAEAKKIARAEENRIPRGSVEVAQESKKPVNYGFHFDESREADIPPMPCHFKKPFAILIMYHAIAKARRNDSQVLPDIPDKNLQRGLVRGLGNIGNSTLITHQCDGDIETITTRLGTTFFELQYMFEAKVMDYPMFGVVMMSSSPVEFSFVAKINSKEKPAVKVEVRLLTPPDAFEFGVSGMGMDDPVVSLLGHKLFSLTINTIHKVYDEVFQEILEKEIAGTHSLYRNEE